MVLVMRMMMRGMWSKMATMAHTLPYDYAVVPGARRRTLPGQNHGAVMMAPKVIAPALDEFFRVGS